MIDEKYVKKKIIEFKKAIKPENIVETIIKVIKKIVTILYYIFQIFILILTILDNISKIISGIITRLFWIIDQVIKEIKRQIMILYEYITAKNYRLLMTIIDIIIKILIYVKRNLEIKAIYLENNISTDMSISLIDKLHALKIINDYQLSSLYIDLKKNSNQSYTIVIFQKNKKPFISYESFIFVFINYVQNAIDKLITKDSKLLISITAYYKEPTINILESITETLTIEIKKSYIVKKNIISSIHNIFYKYNLILKKRNFNKNIIQIKIDIYIYDTDSLIGIETLNDIIK